MMNMNNKFKTAMCKHYQTTGLCHNGPKCSFAHGEKELRGYNDPMPVHVATPTSFTPKLVWDAPGQQQQQGGQSTHSNPGTAGGPGTFKTTRCKFFEKGFCKFSSNCNFAHGDQELRSPNSFPTPQGSHPSNANKSSTAPTTSLQNQVASSQLSYLASQLESYHANDSEILATAKKAAEMNQAGNAQGAASIIYSIMNRHDKTEQDHENYAAMTFTAQQMGDNLYQQLQFQQYSQKNKGGNLNNTESVQAGGFESSYKPSFGQNQNSFGQQGQSYNEMSYQNEPQPQHSSFGNQSGGGYSHFGFSGNNQGNYGQQYYQQAHY